MKQFRKLNKAIMSVALATTMALGFAVAPVPALLDGGQSVVYAEAHNSNQIPPPDAEGQGKNLPFQLWEDRYSTIRPGDQNVPTDSKLVMAFTKNATSTRPKYPDDPYDVILVNYNKVRLQKILRDDSGVEIGTTLVGGEAAQIKGDLIPEGYDERAYRNYILLDKIPALEANTEYRIVIDADFQAANGVTLGAEKSIDFKTATN